LYLHDYCREITVDQSWKFKYRKSSLFLIYFDAVQMQQHDGNNPIERAVGTGYDAGEGGHQQSPPRLCRQSAHLSGIAACNNIGGRYTDFLTELTHTALGFFKA
jgi:hypothetical protein